VLAETALNLADGIGGDGATFEAAVVNPLLNGDVCCGFVLEVAHLGVLAVFAVQGTLNIDRMGVVPLDQVAVVAVHRAHKSGQRSQEALGQ
jgi:hypothetical protein